MKVQKVPFEPTKETLDRYAEVLVNFALNSGVGVKRGEAVFLQVPESAKPLLIALNKAILRAGAHPIIQYLPDEMTRDFFDHANDEQIKFFPAYFLKGKVQQADHVITVIAETNKHELEGVDPKKIMDRNKVFKPYKDWLDKKEASLKFTWTLAMYGTEAMAKEAEISLRECWEQIIKACFLDFADPVGKWQKAKTEIERIKQRLNQLEIAKIHVEAKNTNLIVGIGQNRVWRGGDGRNIPSFEIFTSPDWRLTEGDFVADLPLYRFGNLIQDIQLRFQKGKVVNLEAKKGRHVLEEMIKVKNANKIGEFSLTDVRLSKINKFMAETLFDENFGGKYGNCHLALGSSYKETYPGELIKVKKSQWREMGYNESVIHTDIISTEDRIVTACLENGEKKIIYKNGGFVV